MDTEPKKRLLALTERDAIIAIENARAEAGSTDRPLRHTNAYFNYDNARQRLCEVAGIVTPIGLGAPASVWKERFREVTANLSLENVKFIFYAAKVRI